MKKQLIITIDLTKGEKEFWEQLEEAHAETMRFNKPNLWKRIKSWF